MDELTVVKMGRYADENGDLVSLFAVPYDVETGESIAVFRTIFREGYCDDGVEMCMPLDDFLKQYTFTNYEF